MLRVKICGITQPEQGRSIAQLGATALGFICFPKSPRYVTPEQIRVVVDALPSEAIDRVGVFVNASIAEISQVAEIALLNVVQLHGDEPPAFCDQVRSALPEVEIIKAFRIRDGADLEQVKEYGDRVDTLLLDAYHPGLLGGTGQTLEWSILQQFCPDCPWFLAGGITPHNVLDALQQIQPNGIDLSSGVEHSPGNKDLTKVAYLFEQIRHFSLQKVSA